MYYADFQEKRAHMRFPARMPINYTLACGPINYALACGPTAIDDKSNAKTNDISAEGLGLLTDEELVPGESIQICMQMVDNNEKILVRGKVVWSTMIEPGTYRVGLKLEDSVLNPIPLALRIIKIHRKY